jgi:3-phenylpropionate/trans-cinnamate dioxygenase ferredoxin reductase component
MTEPYGLLIVGGGPAGLAAARSFREHDRDARVAIVSDEHRMPYRRPPLTKELLRGEASEAELPIEPEEWLDEQEVELISGRAVALEAEERVVRLSGGRPLDFVRCLLATGGEPARLAVAGSDHPRVRVVRTLDHVRELLIRLGDYARVVVIGSGFIGCEIASSLRMRGHQVDLVSDEAAPNIARLGEAAAGILRDWLAGDGVRLHLSTPLERIERVGDAAAVRAGSDRIVADVIVMAAGVTPRSELALQAGLALDGGAIPVDSAMRTGRDGLLAAGDVCKAQNDAAGRPLRVEHWGDAVSQGEVAGATAAGAEAGWDSVPGFWSTIGERTLKYAAWGDGWDEATLERHCGGSFTVWYGAGARLVGVLTHGADEDYERGSELIGQGASWPL